MIHEYTVLFDNEQQTPLCTNLDNTVHTHYNAGFGRQRLIPALYRVLNVQIASRAPCGHFRSSDMSITALSVEAYPLELL